MTEYVIVRRTGPDAPAYMARGDVNAWPRFTFDPAEAARFPSMTAAIFAIERKAASLPGYDVEPAPSQEAADP